MRSIIENEYFDWLCRIVCGDDRFRRASYYNLLCALHDREFTWTICHDENRAEEGVYLRSRFAFDIGHNQSTIYVFMSGPCSVLEMMIALALRCEETIMSDPEIGDRTTQWFWGMIRSLGLMGMHSDEFNEENVNHIIDTFLSRQYSRDGKGGLFTIKNCESDLRGVEIWHQLCWYLDNIEGY